MEILRAVLFKTLLEPKVENTTHLSYSFLFVFYLNQKLSLSDGPVTSLLPQAGSGLCARVAFGKLVTLPSVLFVSLHRR